MLQRRNSAGQSDRPREALDKPSRSLRRESRRSKLG
jgi:hypothetical protein